MQIADGQLTPRIGVAALRTQFAADQPEQAALTDTVRTHETDAAVFMDLPGKIFEDGLGVVADRYPVEAITNNGGLLASFIPPANNAEMGI